MNVQTRFAGLIHTVAAGADGTLPSRRTFKKTRHSHGMGHTYDMVSLFMLGRPVIDEYQTFQAWCVVVRM